VAAPVVGYLLVHNYHAAALSLFAYAGITDLVDGWIARKYKLQTVVGTIIDPMADKLLMTIGVACLAVNGSLPGKYLIGDAWKVHKCLTGVKCGSPLSSSVEMSV
jgi:phosphatidylglycerophosphate synthase